MLDHHFDMEGMLTVTRHDISQRLHLKLACDAASVRVPNLVSRHVLIPYMMICRDIVFRRLQDTLLDERHRMADLNARI